MTLTETKIWLDGYLQGIGPLESLEYKKLIGLVNILKNKICDIEEKIPFSQYNGPVSPLINSKQTNKNDR